jgi:DNA segregation ATPase FtsK/SpoIIIE, S-DNA-T family
VHLILCTQRPAGVVREALLANCGLRLSLRVNNTADSRAVIGSDSAAILPADRPGLLVAMVNGVETLARVATTTAVDVTVVSQSNPIPPKGKLPRRPWLDPLPPRIPISSLPHVAGFSFVLGVRDEPEKQRQPVAAYSPETDGALLAIGAHGSGKSELLAVLQSQRTTGRQVVSIPRDVEGAWDELSELHRRCGSEEPDEAADRPRIVALIDDLDSLYARLGDEYRREALDMVATLLRDGPSSSIYVVASAQRMNGPLQSLVPLFGEVLLLRMPNRHEHVLAGGDPEHFEPDRRPGLGSTAGHIVQLAASDADGAESDTRPRHRGGAVPLLRLKEGKAYALVTKNPKRRSELLKEMVHDTVRVVDVEERSQLSISQSSDTTVFVGTPDSWQAQWALLSSLRTRATLVFDGCTPAEAKAITRRPELPPPLAAGGGRVWVYDESGEYTRAKLFPSRR